MQAVMPASRSAAVHLPGVGAGDGCGEDWGGVPGLVCDGDGLGAGVLRGCAVPSRWGVPATARIGFAGSGDGDADGGGAARDACTGPSDGEDGGLGCEGGTTTTGGPAITGGAPPAACSSAVAAMPPPAITAVTAAVAAL